MLSILARPFLDALLSAFGRTLTGWIDTWRAHSDAVARGRLEAELSAARRAIEARDAMDSVGELSDAEVLRRLVEGEA